MFAKVILLAVSTVSLAKAHAIGVGGFGGIGAEGGVAAGGVGEGIGLKHGGTSSNNFNLVSKHAGIVKFVGSEGGAGIGGGLGGGAAIGGGISEGVAGGVGIGLKHGGTSSNNFNLVSKHAGIVKFVGSEGGAGIGGGLGGGAAIGGGISQGVAGGVGIGLKHGGTSSNNFNLVSKHAGFVKYEGAGIGGGIGGAGIGGGAAGGAVGGLHHHKVGGTSSANYHLISKVHW